MERVQKEKKRTKRASELIEEQESKRLDTEDLLADIDAALEGLDQSLAENYIQQGGE